MLNWLKTESGWFASGKYNVLDLLTTILWGITCDTVLSKSSYLSGRGMVGYIPRMMLTSSEQWPTLSTMQYLPFAEETSYARICPRATSLTFTHPKQKLGYVKHDPEKINERFGHHLFSLHFLVQSLYTKLLLVESHSWLMSCNRHYLSNYFPVINIYLVHIA